ncbi:M20 family metallopeptidase [Rhodococcus antarcticus]|uniref:Peptidase M20 domain-containing protein 2 n=1 Tax=Rhodococcus antarcticus TaxID=2987751 RepID=A0ABY6P4A6_9NOCA|nr:M20 family metallopeptidase [Rhodococcus antarcticus]UZJ26491.1 M20 family metallopeptidase [Rhodococcus antarcticus]
MSTHAAELHALSHSLHAEPEIAFAERRSAAKLTESLSQHGFDVRRGVAGLPTAFDATFGSGELVIGLCAEYDALPEVGHACGHNVIAAAALGAGFALAEVADELGITVRVIGTPAEETGGGKVLMLDAGVFDGVAAAMMVHPNPVETVASPSLAIADVAVRYTGKESHAAAAPHLGRNAADAITVAQVGIGLLRQHLEPGQMVHGIVSHGGAAPNIVPAHTEALYYLRARDLESLRRITARARDCFAAGALATGCTHDVVEISPTYAELAPDAWLAQAYRTAVTALGRTPLSRAEEVLRQAGSTDMGNVTRALPGIHPTVAIDCGDAVNHQPEFAAACVNASADRAVLDGATALAHTAIAAATDADQRDRLLEGVARR